jgi:hypothetical protein
MRARYVNFGTLNGFVLLHLSVAIYAPGER